jgi:chitinase
LTLTRTSTSSSDFVRPVITWTYSPGPYPSLQTTNPGQPDPTPPGPPPPPPPGFAPTVKVTQAAPGPTCKPGQPCGKPCLLNCNPRDTGCFGICGCIGPLCPGKSCIGSGCLAAAGQPSDCDSVTTVSDCLVECSVIRRPTTTHMRCDDPDCTRTAAGCEISGTTSTTTRTRM